MKTLLAPTDFSKTSHNAINYACEIAKLTKSKLILLHVYQYPIVNSEVPLIVPIWEDMEKDLLNTLKKVQETIFNKYGKSIEVECLCKMGFSVDEMIKQCVDERHIDLVVMGMQGAGYLTEKLMGSNTTALIKNSKCPVMVVNENAEFKHVKKIVLAFDYQKKIDNSVFTSLKEFVKLFESEVYILNVVEDMKNNPSLENAAAGISLEHSLEDINHSFHFIENKDVINGINEFVTQKMVDMIVIIPQKYKFLESIFHERNTKRMAFHTTVPLLVLHE